MDLRFFRNCLDQGFIVTVLQNHLFKGNPWTQDLEPGQDIIYVKKEFRPFYHPAFVISVRHWLSPTGLLTNV